MKQVGAGKTNDSKVSTDKVSASELTEHIKQYLREQGAALVGVADLLELPAEVRQDMPIGISVAVRYPGAVIQGISKLPTGEYFNWYNKLNDQLDNMVTLGANELMRWGYDAVAMTRAQVGAWRDDISTPLPYKTIAIKAGLGWIGKSALMVTKQYGSMVRLSGILTNAVLEVDQPTTASNCGSCTICADVCPGGAIVGNLWHPNMERKDLLDAVKCRDTAKKRSKQGFGGDATICGKCIEACPYTKKAVCNYWEI